LRHWRGAGLVGKDRAAGAPRRRIDREHRDFASFFREHTAQRIDGRGLADARRPGNADAYRVAGGAQERLSQRGGGAAVIGALTFDKRNGARQHAAIAGTDVAGEAADIGRWSRRHHVAVSSASMHLPSSQAAAARNWPSACRRYGFARAEVEREIDAWIKTLRYAA
jgi:hypothetical protein